jgi:hypothetical protein
MKLQSYSTIGTAMFALSLGLALPTTQVFAAATSGAATMRFSTEADMEKLIGQSIKNAQGDTVGDVEAVHVDSSGKITNVIVGVGGFLGVGEREVALSWKDLTVSDEGREVRTNMTKDALKALPEYKYKQASWRGTVFRD